MSLARMRVPLAAAALVGALLFSTSPSAAAGGLSIKRGPAEVEIVAGAAHWTLSTTTFDVVHAGAVGGKARLGPGHVSIEALGGPVTFGPPTEVTTGADTVELRGWASVDKHLWYVAHYQFFADKPFARLVLTVTDRHDSSPEKEPGSSYWRQRTWARWRLEVGAPGGKPTSLSQYNSYSAGRPGEPWIDTVAVSGAPYQWEEPSKEQIPTPTVFQIQHGAKDGGNQVIWHPMVKGAAKLTALITSLSGGADYKAAKTATYEIVDGAGQTHVVTIDQHASELPLGTFTLGATSVVRLKATGQGEQIALAGPLRVAVAGRAPFDVKMGARADGVLSDGPVTLAVKDFWQHHPMTMFRTAGAIGWQAIESPALFTGGMGLTLETMISMDGPAEAATKALYAPPRRELPARAVALGLGGATTTTGPYAARYDALLRLFAGRFDGALERSDNFGWRNWGDYQIGSSYSDAHGQLTEEWANLQYDLPTGLLVTWLRTGDPAVWRFAQASVRHLMDIDLVKFMPFADKLDGLVYRKGEMVKARSHTDAEPITDQGFAFRSLLLYYDLTGETWALDLAKQNIERLVYYATTRPHFVLNGDRPTAWMLRAALAGETYFPNEPGHDYPTILAGIVRQLVDEYHDNGRLPGGQPVWQGQMLEGLFQVYQHTNRKDVGDVIVGHVRHLLTDAMRRRPDGAIELLYCYTPHGSNCPEAQWTTEENYVFLWLGAISAAGKISKDPFFARWADTLFAYGEAKMSTHDDLRSWTSVLGFPHLLLTSGPAPAKK